MSALAGNGGRGGRRLARGIGFALWGVAIAATAAAESPVALRYGWAAGEVWHGTHRTLRETRIHGEASRDRGVAEFEYRVVEGEPEGALRLEAKLLSQQTAEGSSPLDFSPISFSAQVDAHGRLRGAHYEIGEAKPPVVDGAALDPIAFRQMLRQVASSWRGAVFWFPELPERSLGIGDSFVVDEARNLAESEPGMSMRMHSSRTYRLLAVEGGVARFRVEEVSQVDAATAGSGIASEQRADGEALFDLGLGMWTRQELVSAQRASYVGAMGLREEQGEVSGSTSTTLEMRRVQPP